MQNKKHKLVEISFLDHCLNLTSPMKCRVVGYIIEDAKEFYRVSHWITETDDKEVFDTNLENTVILKCTIKKVRKL